MSIKEPPVNRRTVDVWAVHVTAGGDLKAEGGEVFMPQLSLLCQTSNRVPLKGEGGGR